MKTNGFKIAITTFIAAMVMSGLVSIFRSDRQGTSSDQNGDVVHGPMMRTALVAGSNRRSAVTTQRGRPIRSDDRIRLEIADPNIEGVVNKLPRTVDTAGRINLPFIGRIQASGRT